MGTVRSNSWKAFEHSSSWSCCRLLFGLVVVEVTTVLPSLGVYQPERLLLGLASLVSCCSVLSVLRHLYLKLSSEELSSFPKSKSKYVTVPVLQFELEAKWFNILKWISLSGIQFHTVCFSSSSSVKGITFELLKCIATAEPGYRFLGQGSARSGLQLFDSWTGSHIRAVGTSCNCGVPAGFCPGMRISGTCCG